MKYYTAKGDSGTTKLFNCPAGVRLSKTEPVVEALGGVDELNCFIGWARSVAERASFRKGKRVEVLDALRVLQEDLFVIQAELGGGDMKLSEETVKALETRIEQFAEQFPPIHSFVIPGATELGALLDVSRAVARRVERLYLSARPKSGSGDSAIAAYLNRLSSLLYCIARYANHGHGAPERAPSYGDSIARGL